MPEYTPPTPEGFFDQFFGAEETPPPGFSTVKQVAQAYGITEASAQNRLERLITSGEVERRQYRVRNAAGRMLVMWHYGPKTREEPGH